MNIHKMLLSAKYLEDCLDTINKVKDQLNDGDLPRAESHLDNSLLNLQSAIDYIFIEIKEVI